MAKYLGSSLGVLLALSVSSCTTVQQSSVGNAAKNTFASDDPCSNNARNRGMLLGALGGAAVGYALGDKDSRATLAGGVLGLMVGHAIGSEMDKKRCDLYKISKQYNLKMEIKTVNENGLVVDNKPNSKSENSIGLTVNIGEQDGKSHFAVGSDKLTPEATEYFSAIADTYNPQIFASSIQNADERVTYLKAAKDKKILLVGHTDDTGDSQFNKDLSEGRARAVAKFLKDRGIPEHMLYFQGAGESLPRGDNRTEAGRAQNRRVEIVEIANEEKFQKYLEARQPRHEFYRPVTPSLLAKQSDDLNRNKNVSNTPSPAPKTAKASKIASTQSPYNYGGQPLNSENTQVDLGLSVKDAGFSLFSQAYAEDAVVLNSCERDRPRAIGSIKSLGSEKTYATTDYLPGLYNTSWHDTLNGNLVMLNHVGVLRSSASPSNLPELKIYANYNPANSKTAKADVKHSPSVTTYRGTKGVLYRVFADGAGGIQCMDVLLPLQGGVQAKSGQLLYSNQGQLYVADYKPKMIR
jgi:outer membrane protein OmpA-like peptidoglycan-associated protein